MATNDDVKKAMADNSAVAKQHREHIADTLKRRLEDLAGRIGAMDARLDPALQSVLKSKWTPIWVLLYTLASVAAGFKLNALL